MSKVHIVIHRGKTKDTPNDVRMGQICLAHAKDLARAAKLYDDAANAFYSGESKKGNDLMFKGAAILNTIGR